jgi:hypothetical protein
MKKRSILLLFAVIGLSLQAIAYRTATVAYQSGYSMDCYIPNSFTGCPAPNDTDPDFYACGPSNATILILMHGGFFEFGNRSSMTPYALGFASLENMIVLNIDYRKGWGYNPASPCSGSNLALQTASYRVIQDANAAINYFINNAADPAIGIANPEKYTWNVFAGGYSAGGVTALNMHATQAELDNEIPLVTAAEGVVTRTPYTYKFLGCFAIGGGAANLTYIKEGTYNVLFHGENDPIMPYTFGYPVNQNCSTYTPVHGGFDIYQYIDNNPGFASCKLYSKAGGHGAFASSQADVLFVVNKFVSSISEACYWTSCGMIPGPPFWAGKNCPELMPNSGDVGFMSPPSGVRERESLTYLCLVPARLAASTEEKSPSTLQEYMNIPGQKTLTVFGVDGRKLYDGQSATYNELAVLLNTRFPNLIVIIELTAEGVEPKRFKYFGVE